jgi:hypothetical protein
MTAQGQQASKHPRWEAWKRSFKESNYITDFWTWLLTLLSKSAELVLFGSILYSSYQLVPGVPPVPPAIDAFLFLVQQAALDIGGMGLLKLAKRAGLSKASFPMRVGVTLVVLMIMNVVLASVKHTMPMVPADVFVTIETLLLIARAVMAVLFGHAIHALREEYGESTITIHDANALQQRMEELSAELTGRFNQQGQRLTEEIAQVESTMQQRLTVELATVQETAHRSLSESSTGLASSLQTQLAHELASLQERLQEHHAELALLPDVQARLQHLESATHEEIHRMRAALEKQAPTQVEEPQKREERPQLHAVPTGRATKFDARAFVFSCLQDDPDAKLAEIAKRAATQRQELSQSSISRYRSQFFARSESSSVAHHASSTMQVESSSIDECMVAS